MGNREVALTYRIIWSSLLVGFGGYHLGYRKLFEDYGSA